MAINFNLFQSQQPMGGIVGSAGGGDSGGDDGGIGDLFGGLQSLIGGFAGGGNGGNSVSGASSGPSVSAGMSQPQVQAAPQISAGPSMQASSMSPIINRSPNISSGISNPGLIQSNSPIFNTAQKLIGTSETNPVMKNYLQKANPGLDPAQTPWCAGFVGSVLGANGIKGTGSLAAKSYLNYGTPVTKPGLGDIVVLNRTNDPSLGHVGFYAGEGSNGMIKILGGNQGNSVSIKEFPMSSVAGYRQVPTGQQVQQFAQQNKIGSPQQLSGITSSPIFQPKQSQNINNLPEPAMNAIQGARQVYQGNDVMSGVAASQAILESRLLGNPSGLAKNYNNYFGIKGKGSAGSAMMGTKEYINGRMTNTRAPFAAYKTPAESFQQHQQLMDSPRYDKVRNAQSVEEAAVELQKAGYATDPNYARQVIDIYNKYVKPNSGSMGNVPRQKMSLNESDSVLRGTSNTSPNQTINPEMMFASSSRSSFPSQSNPQEPIPINPNDPAYQGHGTPIRDLTPEQRDFIMRNMHGENGGNGGGINWQLLNYLMGSGQGQAA